MASRAGIGGENVDKLVEMAENMPLTFDGERVLLGQEEVTDAIRTETAGNQAS